MCSSLLSVSTTVIACIQQVPQDTAANDAAHDLQGSAAPEDLAVQEISATAEDYLTAVDEVHSRVPEGWRVMYVRTDDASPDAAPTATGTQEDPPGAPEDPQPTSEEGAPEDGATLSHGAPPSPS